MGTLMSAAHTERSPSTEQLQLPFLLRYISVFFMTARQRHREMYGYMLEVKAFYNTVHSTQSLA